MRPVRFPPLIPCPTPGCESKIDGTRRVKVCNTCDLNGLGDKKAFRPAPGSGGRTGAPSPVQRLGPHPSLCPSSGRGAAKPLDTQTRNERRPA